MDRIVSARLILWLGGEFDGDGVGVFAIGGRGSFLWVERGVPGREDGVQAESGGGIW